MWYFAWILGVLLACAFGIINVLWLEAQESLEQDSVVLDPLTKNLIRFEFLSILREKIEQFQFEQRPFCVMMIGLSSQGDTPLNVDGDKATHALVSYSQIMRGVLPKQKTILARYDACTFAAILLNTNCLGAEALAEQICGISAANSGSRFGELFLSVGITECQNELVNECDNDLTLIYNSLLQNANEAMQTARLQGNNQHLTMSGLSNKPLLLSGA